MSVLLALLTLTLTFVGAYAAGEFLPLPFAILGAALAGWVCFSVYMHYEAHR